MTWVVYILKFNNGNFYTGITNNLEKRIKAHMSGRGSKYVYAHGEFEVVFTLGCENRSEASKIECKIKKMTKKEKINLVAGKQ